MMREKYESLSAAALKEIAKARGLKNISALKKSQVVERMLEEDAKEEALAKDAQAGKAHAAKNDPGREGRNEQVREEQSEPRSASAREGQSEQTREARGTSVREGRNEQAHESRSASVREGRNESARESRNASARETRGADQSYEYRNDQNKAHDRTETLQNREEAEAAHLPQEDRPAPDLAQLDSGMTVEGILEVLPDGYGFIRSNQYLPGENDVYVSPSQIRRFNLRTGDLIAGNTRIKTQQEKFSALLYLKSMNGMPPGIACRRTSFEDMTPIFPNQRLRMERDGKNVAMRIVDMVSPIGKGQRGMIVSPPKAGKTTLLKEMAKSILLNDPDIHLIILLIDERPEEVTDIREAITGDNVEVVYSTFDELPEHHKRVSEMVIERAKRLVEHKKDVVILLDSITRLARAYNLTVPPSGRTLSGGLDPAALHMPKRFFGAARNIREGGSLTILATALVDTGSKMDDVVYEEFKGTGNMELVLDRKLSERRVFPAIDIPKSGTRREDLLLDREEQEAAYIMRKALNGMKSEEAVENILNMFVKTKDNKEFVYMVRRQRYI